MNDTATFGSFIDSFLTSFRDEYLKIPSIIFPLLSDVLLGQIDVDDVRHDSVCVCSYLIEPLSSLKARKKQ